MKMTSGIKIVVLCATLTLLLGACNDATTEGTASTDSSSLTTSAGDVTINALSGGNATVRMPQNIFGASESDRMFSTVEIWSGDNKIAAMPGEQLNYASGTGMAWFTVSSLADGEVVSFVVRSADGDEQIFIATVSDSASVTASLNGEISASDDTEETATEDQGITATFGQLADGRSLIVIPFEAFGDSEDDVDEATIDISLNSEVISEGLSAAAYASSTYGDVRFYLSGLEDGDALRLRLRLADDSTVTFYGDVSADADAEIPQS